MKLGDASSQLECEMLGLTLLQLTIQNKVFLFLSDGHFTPHLIFKIKKEKQKTHKFQQILTGMY